MVEPLGQGTGNYAPPPGNYGGNALPPSNYSGNYPPPANYSSNIAVSALPKTDVTPLPAPAPVSVAQPSARNAEIAPVNSAAVAATSGSPSGESIEVQQGDTLYTLARRYKVSISELMRVNQITDPNIKPGQKLRLPTGARPVAKAAPHPQPTHPVAEVRPLPETPTAPPPAGWTGSYTLKSGDSLYGIARRRGVTVAELQRVNGITDVRKMQPGMVLKVPSEAANARQATAPVPPPASTGVTPQPASGPRPTVLNAPPAAAIEIKGSTSDAEVTVAAAGQANAAKQDPAQPKAAPSAKLRWPVKGRIITGFGARADGTQNDGIDLAVPLGTDVLAAEAGVVAYAGGEVRGYGNLVLVRHDNGWVTAYAHNDQLLVQRGDRVRRGQLLAKAGKTGSVDQPQLHFELRQGPKPVDPVPYMEQM
jgi:murein DD-endopeptidase MepM/ murein hydrolase activator NlpD